jgi:hypothetical protein
MRPTITCAAIASASRTSASPTQSWKAIWCGRADRDLRAHAHQRAHLGERRWRPAGATLDLDEREPHPHLRDHGPPRGAGQPPVEAVDEEHLEDRVDGVRDDEDDERRAQIRHAAQVALPGRGEHERGCAERGDPQVEDGAVADLAVPAHDRHRRSRQRDEQHEQHEPDEEAEPERLRADASRVVLEPGPVQSRHARRGSVGEEVEDRERRAHDRGGDRERGELRRAQMADDRGVDQHVEGLGCQRAERRQREHEDLAVVRGAGHAAPL